jgi:hypothetical protein
VVLGSVSLAHLSTETPPPQGDDERKREQRERVDFTEWLAGATSWRAEALIVAPGSHPSQGDGAWPGVRRYLSLATWGAYLLEAGGHYEEAARERIWSAQCVETLAWSLKAYAQLMGLEPAKDGSHQLLLAGEHALGHALGLIARAAGGKQEGAREGGDGEPAQEERREPSVPWHAKRIARSLGLLAAHLDDELAPRFAARAGDDAATTPREGWAATFRGALVRGLERNAYSMLNHLMTLQVLVLDTALDDEKKGKKLEDGQPFVDELTRLKTDYSSPMHFTPFHYGTAVLAWVLECQSLTENAPGKERLLRPLRESARLALARSREMYNCGDAYYEMIAELSYLDDDFNDRCIHVHHALQMMGAELTNALLARCAADDEERGRGPLADDRPLAQERLPGQAPAQGAGQAG